ncbi:hypothetical protein L228DRAFT_251470 [Xylona heveae TC161]|uniref:TPR domain-containing protein n=1 Tax=Xylona heveae (strain CBS 132557 / TC161) TaxID=1328760 RepID=A0A164ZCS0_XYLHT|nr:hypothetical protein L228DRAFT_251470 [Xylona heveae TC161]KZF18942.1 hypothetical protein L228DRAFT_251470 [Xylona heveae TC161]
MFCRAFAQSTSRRAAIAPTLRQPGATLGHLRPLYTPNRTSRPFTTGAGARELYRNHPFSVSMAAFFILSGAGFLAYSNYIYKTYIIGAFHNFPEPVAQKLRKAIYYTNISLSPRDAVKYYRQALATADELGMDPFSDEILGVKIQLAALFEKIEHYRKAIDVLEIVRRDCLRWIDELGGKDGNEGKRTRVLGKTVGINVKLGELYSNEHVRDREAAEERLTWAVETVLREKSRRVAEGVKPGEGDWMTDEEIGGALETLGHYYEERNDHYLAAPLFLHALTLIPASNCHTVVLMNNLAISLAQQTPPAASGTAPASRSTLIKSAKSWAEKAQAIAADIKPPERNEECDIGCAVALHNLGEFAEMDGKISEARRKYSEARSLAKAIGFEEGIINANDGIKRLSKKQ